MVSYNRVLDITRFKDGSQKFIDYIEKMTFAYSWARPTILAAGKGRGGMLLFLLFLHFHSFSFLLCPSFSSPLLILLSLFSLSLLAQWLCDWVLAALLLGAQH